MPNYSKLTKLNLLNKIEVNATIKGTVPQTGSA